MTPPEVIKGHFDREGRLQSWPARKRRAQQLPVLAYLAEAFEVGRQYREPEVNHILKSRMTYADHVLVRRELYEAKLLDRTIDGATYWRPDSQGGTP